MQKRLLGIDYGDKRLGLALADELGPALPFKILENSQNILQNIKDIIKAENIDIVVVGLPHSLSGQHNDRLEITQNFVDTLRNDLDIPVETIDEQMTSKLYERMGVKKDIDKHSATAILDTYLSKNNAS
ncbi:Holliday junction resolvase RuvX [Patescibacteria group bacterium]|nr:Holliday junction resolvase RuvX [Patescibacteria group bacterium]